MVLDMGLSKNRGKKTQNGWFISWKTLLKWDDLGGGGSHYLCQGLGKSM